MIDCKTHFKLHIHVQEKYLDKVYIKKMKSTFMLEKIPQEIYPLFQVYLRAVDYESFLSTSKLFKEIKYRTRKIYLKDSFSVDLFMNNDPAILGLVNDPRRQIAIYFPIANGPKVLSLVSHPVLSLIATGYECEDPILWEVVMRNQTKFTLHQHHSFSVICSLPHPEHIRLRSLEIRSLKTLRSLETLSFLRELYIESCGSVTNVNCLKHLEKLTIVQCNKVCEYDEIGIVPSLTVISCNGFIDISCLSEHSSLQITGCKNIDPTTCCFEAIKHLRTDLIYTLKQSESQLLSVEKLELIYYEDEAILFNPKLRRLYIEFSLKGLFPDFTPFAQLFQLQLRCLNQPVYDFMPLRNIPVVEISYSSITSLTGLGGNRFVKISVCHELLDFSALKHVPHVEIHCCHKFSDANHVSHVQHLVIHSCNSPLDLSPLAHARHLEVINCIRVSHVELLGNIPILLIRDTFLENLKGLGGKKNHKLILPKKIAWRVLYSDFWKEHYQIREMDTFLLLERKNA